MHKCRYLFVLKGFQKRFDSIFAGFLNPYAFSEQISDAFQLSDMNPALTMMSIYKIWGIHCQSVHADGRNQKFSKLETLEISEFNLCGKTENS